MELTDFLSLLISKLSDPKEISDRATNKMNKLSLSNGVPGILAFLGACEALDLNANLPEICHRYVEIIVKELSKAHYDLSLNEGLVGVISSILLASGNGKKYQSLMTELESHLSDQVLRHLILPIEKATRHSYSLHPSYLNLTNGLSGVIAYLTLRTGNNREIDRILNICVSTLVEYLDRDLILEEGKLPAWYSPKEETLHPAEKYKFPKGSFVFSHAYGVSGYLAALVTYVECTNNTSKTLLDLIEKLSYWLLQNVSKREQQYFWPISASLEETLEKTYEKHLSRDAWCCGVPATALTLYRAGIILQDHELCQFAEKVYLSLFEKDLKDWNLVATSLFYGRAGTLLTTYRMAELTGQPQFKTEYQSLEKDLIRFYDTSHPFGFRSVEVNEQGGYSWEDDPGLLMGASGVAIVLMTINDSHDHVWDRLLLTK